MLREAVCRMPRAFEKVDHKALLRWINTGQERRRYIYQKERQLVSSRAVLCETVKEKADLIKQIPTNIPSGLSSFVCDRITKTSRRQVNTKEGVIGFTSIKWFNSNSHSDRSPLHVE